MTTKEILSKLKQYEARSMHGQLPVVWNIAIGDTVLDIKHKEYIDFTSGICTTNIGHFNSSIMLALKNQMARGILHSYTFPTKIRAEFLEFIIKNTPSFCEKVYLVSSGTEATETAVKLMKMYTKKKGIISFWGSMHGRTMLAEQLKGNYEWADKTDNILHLDFPKKNERFRPITYLRFPACLFPSEIDESKIGGIIIETYQGWSARLYPKKYIQDLCKWARKHNILICFDEIQGGMGRTGKLFNYMHYEVEPDLICVGKGFSGGLPLSGVLGRKDILDTPEEGSMSSTHSANPLCCAVGLANFKEILRILPTVKEKGEILHNFLRKNIKKYKINGKGLIAAIITKTEKEATNISYKAMKKGLLLIKTDRNSVKIAPPLVVTKENLLKGLKILKGIINEKS